MISKIEETSLGGFQWYISSRNISYKSVVETSPIGISPGDKGKAWPCSSITSVK